MHTGAASPTRQRLDSWKEIAVFFECDERTVNRWEKELGLPVHRRPGTKGRVYAYADELSAWLITSRKAASTEDASSNADIDRQDRGLAVVPAPGSTEPTAKPQDGVRYRKPQRFLAVTAFVLLALIFVLIRHPGFNSFKLGSAASPSTTHGIVQASSPAHNPEAEQLYLRGRYFWNKRTPDDLNKAVDYFVQAIVQDPNYAEAYVGLADCYNLLREYTMMPASEAYARSFSAARKAVELDDKSSAAHASLAFVLFYGRWDITGAESEFRRAIDLDPNNAVAHHWYATYLLTVRRLPESLAEIERAQNLDPASTSILADRGDILYHAGRHAEAIALLKQMEITEPTFRSPHSYLQHFYLLAQDYPNFLAESRKDALLVHDPSALAITTAAEKGFAAGGSKAMFESMLQVQKKYYSQRLLSPLLVAQTCALLGNNEEALNYLSAAYAQHDELILSVRSYEELNNLREYPAYRDLLTRMNLPIEN